MSEKQNYDKILLASGIVLGLGVAVYGTVNPSLSGSRVRTSE